jgi:broad specificity phosphatase PhoE
MEPYSARVTSLDIYLCQHGRTQLNREGRLRGRLDPELDLVGLTEARDLAELLGQLSPTRVISSPLRRAVQTAEMIAAVAQVEVELDDRLVDRSYGEHDGALVSELAEKYGRPSAAPGVEPTADLVARASAVLKEIAAQDGTGPVIVVTHDAVIRYVLGALAPGYSPSELVPQRTGAWSLLRWTDGAWKLLAFASKDDPVETVLGS